MSAITFKLRMLHGRDAEDEKLLGWGFDGPTLEGIQWIHWTYGSANIEFVDTAARDKARELTGWDICNAEYSLEPKFNKRGDLMCANGKYYGDWEVQLVESGEDLPERAMTKLEMDQAASFADELLNGCQHPDDYEEVANYAECLSRCPKDFSIQQRDLVHSVTLTAYLRAIGRA